MERQIEMVHAGSLTPELCDVVVCSFIRSLAIVLCESTKAKFSWRWIPQYSSIVDSIWCCSLVRSGFFLLVFAVVVRFSFSMTLPAQAYTWRITFTRKVYKLFRVFTKYSFAGEYISSVEHARVCVCVDRPAYSLCWKSRSWIYIPDEWHRRKATAFYWNKSEGNVGEMNARIIKQE